MANEPDNLLEQLLDVAVYLPVGLFLDSKGRVDEIVDRGRDHTTSQVRLARMIGQFAVTVGKREVERRLADLFAKPAATPPPAPSGDGSGAPEAPTPVVRVVAAVVDGPGTAPAVDAPAARPATRRPVARTRPGAKAAPARRPALAIEGYDTLAASQIIARLDGLTARQLAGVRDHETAHRNRKTILGRIDQLSGR